MRTPATIFGYLAAVAAATFLCVTASDAADLGSVDTAPTRLGVTELRPYLDGYVSDAERRLLEDAADGRWDRHTLATAALVASGVEDPGELARYNDRLDVWLAECKRACTADDSPEEQGRAVFDFMHRRILTGGYQLDASDLTAVFDQGRFNCVSATVLYDCLAARCGLTVCGLEMPGHAKTRLLAGGRLLDVETTCPTWFQVERNTSAANNAHPSALNPQPSPRELSPVELVAMVYYNRGVDLLAENRFAEAAAANAKALLLDPKSDTARSNLLAVLNNWAIELGRRGRYRLAAQILSAGIALEPSYAALKTNYVYVYHRWVDELCRQGRYETALAQLAEAVEAVPGEPYFRQARNDVYNRWRESSSPSRAGFDPDRIAN